jgi:hypothetical protein
VLILNVQGAQCASSEALWFRVRTERDEQLERASSPRLGSLAELNRRRASAGRALKPQWLRLGTTPDCGRVQQLATNARHPRGIEKWSEMTAFYRE